LCVADEFPLATYCERIAVAGIELLVSDSVYLSIAARSLLGSVTSISKPKAICALLEALLITNPNAIKKPVEKRVFFYISNLLLK
tara:strand:- start:223 stop:477 length:255 start_codon:yes stop_codon:yes gene_type:complete